MMKNKYLCLILTVVLAGVSCTGGVDDRGRDSKQKADSSGGDEVGSGNRGKGQGRGQGGAGGSRGVGRGRFDEESYEAYLDRLKPIELDSGEQEAIGIETIQASYRPLKSELPAMGKIVAPPRTMAIVSYAFPARVSEVHVRLGDWVEKGQPVVTLQSEEVGNAKAEYFKARADFELAQRSYERQKRLHDRGVGAEKDYLAAETEFTVAGSNVDAAEKKLHILGFTEEQVKEAAGTHQINPTIVLNAPISGKIVQANAVLGAMVDQDTEILTIMNTNLLRVDAEIYEKDIAKIRVGQEVEVRVQAYPSEVFMGKIQYISDIFKEDTRTTTVYTEVANPAYKLKPGMFADITIQLNHHDRVLALPKSAILDDKDVELVFVKRGTEYVPLIVETGIHENDYVQVVSGIQEGDWVVTAGNFQLKSKLYEDLLAKGHVH